jgi:hypothetical protein
LTSKSYLLIYLHRFSRKIPLFQLQSGGFLVV